MHSDKRKRLILVACVLACSGFAYSQGLKKWTQKQEDAKTEEVQTPQTDGRLYPHSVADNKVVVTGFESFPGVSDETLFVNALLWAIDQGSKLKDDFERVDYSEMRFVCKRKIPSALSQQFPASYLCHASFQVSGDMLSFLVSDIIYESTGVLNTVKKIPFETLNPEKKPKHGEYLKEFTETHSAQLNALLEFVRSNSLPPITHWDEITQGKVTKGMNKVECTLAYGKPVNVKVSGSKEQWMYSSSTYLFFENGVLTSHLK